MTDVGITQSVSKLDAAARQLQMTIVLYFQDGDVLAVHTLAAAARGVLHDLLVHRKELAGVRYPTTNRVRTKASRYVARRVDETSGFLKHADRHPDRMLEFNSNWTDCLLYDAITMHLKLTLAVAAAMLRRLRSFESGHESTGAPATEVANAVLSRIASLGYVGNIAAQATAPPGEQTDPKDRIAVFNKITSLQWENTERRRSLCR